MDAFALRAAIGQERAECLRWIAASRNSTEKEERVSFVLDALWSKGPLVPQQGK